MIHSQDIVPYIYVSLTYVPSPTAASSTGHARLVREILTIDALIGRRASIDACDAPLTTSRLSTRNIDPLAAAPDEYVEMFTPASAILW